MLCFLSVSYDNCSTVYFIINVRDFYAVQNGVLKSESPQTVSKVSK